MRPLSPTAMLLAILLAPAAHAGAAHVQLIPTMCVCEPPTWPSALVPRMTADATLAGGFAMPESLLSTIPTYFNYCTGKNPAVCATWTDALYLDGVPIDQPQTTDCEWVSKKFPELNRAPTFVRGGRHEVAVLADIHWNAATDYAFRPNSVIEQLTWSPAPLPPRMNASSETPPPVANGMFGNEWIPSCDGFQFDSGAGVAWVAGAFAADSASDVDLGLFTDAWHGSTTGFGVEAARSQQPAGWMDFVVGGETPAPARVYPAVIRGAGGATSGYALAWADAGGRRDPTGIGRWQDALAPGLPAAVYEAWLQAGVPFESLLRHDSGAGALTFSAFPPTPGGIWSRQQALAISTYAGPGESARLSFTPSATGWHPIVVFRNRTFDMSEPSAYWLQFGTTSPVGVGSPAPRLFLSAPRTASLDALLAFGLPAAARARLAVYDAQGRLVRALLDASLGAGPHEIAWDLRDEAGRRVDPGAYWARLDTGGARRTARMSVLR